MQEGIGRVHPFYYTRTIEKMSSCKSRWCVVKDHRIKSGLKVHPITHKKAQEWGIPEEEIGQEMCSFHYDKYCYASRRQARPHLWYVQLHPTPISMRTRTPLN